MIKLYKNLFSVGIVLLCSVNAYAFQENDTTYVKQLISEADAAILQGQFNEVYPKLREAQILSDSLDYLYGQATSAASLANAFLQQQQLDSAFSVLNFAIQNYPESKNLYDFHNLLGTAYRYKNQNEEALFHYRESLKLISRLSESDQLKQRAGISQNMATVLLRIGNQAEAFEHYLNAVRFSEMTKDTLFWVVTLNNIGNSYNTINNYESAAYYLEKAKELAIIKNLRNELYRIHLNLANARSDQNQYEEALKNYNAALQLLEEIRPGAPPVAILYNLGNLNSNIGNFDDAERYYRESLAYSEELQIPQGLYYNNYGLGNLYYKLNRFNESVSYLNIALQTAEQIGDIPFMQESRSLLYRVYRDAGNFENAYFHLEKYHFKSDSLFSIEKSQALANMENQLALDRQSEINRLLQEKQFHQENRLRFQLMLIITAVIIILLISIILFLMRKRDKEREEINKQLKFQKKELEEANDAKNKLFSRVAHDLRSPLTSLQGILYLIKNEVLSQENIQEMALQIESSVQQNINTMEDLLVWASEQLSGQKIDVRKLEVQRIANDVIMKLSYSANQKNIRLINEIPENLQLLGDENALQLVLRNLVSNGIKFTPKNGKITLSGYLEAGKAKVAITDTGIGILPEDEKKVFSKRAWTRKGTENEKGTGLGLNLCKDFIEKMNGEIWFESEPEKGTTFFFTLPVANDDL